MAPYYACMMQVGLPFPPAVDPVLVLQQGYSYSPDFSQAASACEKSGLEVNGFRVVKTGAMPKQATTASLKWDQSGLEVVFSCRDNAIVADQKGPGNIKLWKDDSVYLWLDPGHSHNGNQNHMMAQISAGQGSRANGGTFVSGPAFPKSSNNTTLCRINDGA